MGIFLFHLQNIKKNRNNNSTLPKLRPSFQNFFFIRLERNKQATGMR